MTKLGEYILAIQHGNWGYFGNVELEVELLSSGTGVEISIPEEVLQWQAGIRFGITYAYEKCRSLGSPPRAVRVIVTRAQGHAVDTTEVVMAFSSAHALWKALNETPMWPPKLNIEDGTFTFPK